MQNTFSAYLTELATLETFVNRLTREQLEYKCTPEKWNAIEIIAHLVDAEFQVYCRYRSILADTSPYLVNYNEAQWGTVFNHAKSDPHANLILLKQIRAINYALIETLDDRKLEMWGLHSVRGKMTVRQLIEAHITHIKNHTGQIKRNQVELSQQS